MSFGAQNFNEKREMPKKLEGCDGHFKISTAPERDFEKPVKANYPKYRQFKFSSFIMKKD
jgi:hypothetical protein